MCTTYYFARDVRVMTDVSTKQNPVGTETKFLRCLNISGTSFLESLFNVRSKTLKERYK